MKPPKVTSYNEIPGLLKIELDSFLDLRGENCELFDETLFREFIPDISIRTVSLSRSGHNVLRGFHGDTKSWKVVKPNVGAIQLFVLDSRIPNEGSFLEFNLVAESNTWIVLPPRVLNAHLCLTNCCEFLYLLSDGYVAPKDQIHVKWNKYNLPWKCKNPILSQRDS